MSHFHLVESRRIVNLEAICSIGCRYSHTLIVDMSFLRASLSLTFFWSIYINLLPKFDFFLHFFRRFLSNLLLSFGAIGCSLFFVVATEDELTFPLLLAYTSSRWLNPNHLFRCLLLLVPSNIITTCHPTSVCGL